MLVHPARIRPLSPNAPQSGPIVYWMHRDQRAVDNWSLAAAGELAGRSGAPLIVVFALARDFPGTTDRHYDFMLRGLAETEAALRTCGIPLVLVTGNPAVTVPALLAELGAGVCVTDFDPLRIKKRWKALCPGR